MVPNTERKWIAEELRSAPLCSGIFPRALGVAVLVLILVTILTC